MKKRSKLGRAIATTMRWMEETTTANHKAAAAAFLALSEEERLEFLDETKTKAANIKEVADFNLACEYRRRMEKRVKKAQGAALYDAEHDLVLAKKRQAKAFNRLADYLDKVHGKTPSPP